MLSTEAATRGATAHGQDGGPFAIPRATEGSGWWTVERGLYALLLVAGAFLRAWNLEGAPLSAWEAGNAWPAWLAARGLAVDGAPTPTSALGYGLQWLVFWIGVNSDAGARIVAWAMGSALVLLPWWLRGVLRREAALILALLIAVDPWLIQFSRMADGSLVGLALAGLALVIGARLVTLGENPEARMIARLRTVLAVALGLALSAGPLGLNLAPVIAAAGWLWRRELRAAGVFARAWWLWVGAAALLGSSFGLVRLEGPAMVAASLTVWLSQFSGSPATPTAGAITGLYGLGWPWVRLLIDAPLTLLVGILGWGRLYARSTARDTDRRPLIWLTAWLGWGVLLWVMPGNGPLALPVLGLVLTVLGADWLARWATAIPREVDWREPVAVIVTILILLFSVSFSTAKFFHNRVYEPNQAWSVLIALALGLFIVAVYWVWARRDVGLWVTTLLVVGLLFAVNLRSAWHLKQETVTDRAGWQALTTHPDMRLLAADVATLSALRTGDATELAVQIQVAPITDAGGRTIPAVPDPVVGWTLRNMRNVTWVQAPVVSAEQRPAPLIVVPGATLQAALDQFETSMYVGSQYRVETYWLPDRLERDPTLFVATDPAARLWAETLRPWFRWKFYREVFGEIPTRTVALWASALEER